jgi:acyl-CoA thioester hydrolase
MPSSAAKQAEPEDFVVDQNGVQMLSSSFLLSKKSCCKNDCRQCPYGFDAEQFMSANQKSASVRHHYPLRVDFCALDRGGDVYHPRYLNYLDRARVLMLEDSGIAAPDLFAKGLKWRVKSCSMQFHKQLNWQDFGKVHTEITYVGKTEFSCKQWIFSAGTAGEVDNLQEQQATFFANSTIELCDLKGNKQEQIPAEVALALQKHQANS